LSENVCNDFEESSAGGEIIVVAHGDKVLKSRVNIGCQQIAEALNSELSQAALFTILRLHRV
jgi:hypothetical protein